VKRKREPTQRELQQTREKVMANIKADQEKCVSCDLPLTLDKGVPVCLNQACGQYRLPQLHVFVLAVIKLDIELGNISPKELFYHAFGIYSFQLGTKEKDQKRCLASA